MSAIATAGMATGVSADVVLRNRRLWATLVLAQVAGAAAVVVALAAWCGPGRWDVPPRTVPVDVLLLAMGVVLSVLHRRHPELTGHAARVRRRYGRNVTLPMAMLVAASLFGFVIVYVSGDLWPAAVVPVASMAVQLTVCPRTPAA